MIYYHCFYIYNSRNRIQTQIRAFQGVSKTNRECLTLTFGNIFTDIDLLHFTYSEFYIRSNHTTNDEDVSIQNNRLTEIHVFSFKVR